MKPVFVWSLRSWPHSMQGQKITSCAESPSWACFHKSAAIGTHFQTLLPTVLYCPHTRCTLLPLQCFVYLKEYVVIIYSPFCCPDPLEFLSLLHRNVQPVHYSKLANNDRVLITERAITLIKFYDSDINTGPYGDI